MTRSNLPSESSILRPAARPVSFGRDFAFFHEARGETGLVICGTWGYDELCSRKFLRLLAEQLCDAGFPVLRFDYPGTNNMLDPEPDTGLEGWIEHTGLAADRLKQLSGCSQITYLGFGLGSALAFMAAKERSDIAGLVLAAPVVSGRRYMRELQLQAKVTNEKLGIALKDRHGDTGFASFQMSEKLQADLKSIKLSATDLNAGPRCLVLAREGNEPEFAFAEKLSEAGCNVQSGTFEGYLQLLLTPTTSAIPDNTLHQITEWSRQTFPATPQRKRAVSRVSNDAPKAVGKHFVEAPVRFGKSGQFFGVHCGPRMEPHGPTLVFLNAGYLHHAGWGRIWVRAARELAAKGISTFRFDMANVGETPPTPGCPEQVLYTDSQFDDIGVAVDYLKSVGHQTIVLAARCSGAYSAMHTCARRKDIDGALLINQLKLIWNPDEDIYEILTTGARPLDEYRRRAFRLETFERLFKGDVDLKRAIPNILSQVKERLVRAAAPYLGSLTQLGRNRKDCFQVFDTLRKNGTPIYMLTCEHDGSLDELARYFGANYEGLKAYPNVSMSVIPDTDHNLTPVAAQNHLVDMLAQVALDPRWKQPGKKEAA